MLKFYCKIRVAGINAALACLGKPPRIFPAETAIGSLAAYVSGGAKGPFQPMNASFGLIKAPSGRFKSRLGRCRAISENSLGQIRNMPI